MNESFESLIREWPGLAVVLRRDQPSGSWIFIALHDDRLGPPVGGTRMKPYDRPVDGLRDAMRLASGMTDKWAALGLDSGGGKAVLAVPAILEGATRRGLLRRYGRLVESLHGGFATGRDLGTTDEDMRTLAEVTRYVHGVDKARGATRDPGPYTAAGVLASMRAVLPRIGKDGFEGCTVVIQGVGDVGAPLARSLARQGATLLLSDLDIARAEDLAAELKQTVIEADAVHDTRCDIYAPCAIGATIHAESVPRLRCRAVVGSANNQLAEDVDAERLAEAGILYAPDFIANGGGALAFGLIQRGQKDEETLLRAVAGIEQTLAAVFEVAARRGEPTLHAARRLVRQRLNPGPADPSES